jgi:hypothetical protein
MMRARCHAEDEMSGSWVRACLLLALAAPPVGAATLERGDVLLNHFGGKIQQYRGSGVVDTILPGATDSWAGVAATRAGLVATMYRTPVVGLSLFDPGEGVLDEPTVAGITVPTDLEAFSDGGFAVASQNQNEIVLLSAAGAVLGAIDNATMSLPFGLDVAPDDTIWVASRGSQDVDHFSRAGADLGGFALGYEPGEIVVDPADGSLWIANRLTGAVQHRSAAGALLGTVATGVTANTTTPLHGLAMTGDGILLVLDVVESRILRFTRAGAPDGEIDVPVPDNPFRLTVVPEPEAAASALAAAVTLLGVAAGRARR